MKTELENVKGLKPNVILESVKTLILENEFTVARALFNCIPKPKRCSFDYKLCKASLQFESSDFEELSQTYHFIYEPKGLIDTVKICMANDNWKGIERYIRIASVFRDFLPSDQKGLFYVYLLVIDLHNQNSFHDKIVLDLNAIVFADFKELCNFIIGALVIADCWNNNLPLCTDILNQCEKAVSAYTCNSQEEEKNINELKILVNKVKSEVRKINRQYKLNRILAV